MRARPTELDAVVAARHLDPHRVLGVHTEAGTTVVRAFRPDARAMLLHVGGRSADMELVRPEGLFEAIAAEPLAPADYQLEVRNPEDDWRRFHDPYAFAPTCGDLDLHLIGEGTHAELYDRLGARVIEHQAVRGTAFAVWAPQAQRVSVVGDFNDWDGRVHAMRQLDAGIWELFVPGVGAGALYKLEVVGLTGEVVLKADPFARSMELRPLNACRVDEARYAMTDGAWLAARAETDLACRPVSIYEVHLGSWRRDEDDHWLGYRALATELCDYVIELGFTHIELMPIMEHPLDASWGYQVSGYFAPTSRYGTPDDLRAFIDACHARGIGVILDWVPAHFPKDAFALGRFDGTALYEHLDPRLGEHRQWGTYVFNYGRPEVQNFLYASALYWFEVFHVDGLRADAVASMLHLDYAAEHPDEWLPNAQGGRENFEAAAFLRSLTERVHARFPGALMIAEESTTWPGVTHPSAAGGLGFDMKWNMGWMHDTLDYFALDPVFRSFRHNLMTFSLMYAYSERFLLPLSHDEVVHLKRSLVDKMSGDRWQKFAHLRALYGYMWAHPGKKLLFMGGEIAQWTEWSETTALSWSLLHLGEHAGVQRLVRDLNHLYRAYPALYAADFSRHGFRWIDPNDHGQSVLSFIRFARAPSERAARGAAAARAKGGPAGVDPEHDVYVVCIANLTPVARHGYRIGVPRPGLHREILNTDAEIYRGSGIGNLGQVHARDEPSHGFPCCAEVTLPPLAVVWLAGPVRGEAG